MNKHYFFKLPKDELEFLKEEYFDSNIVLFTKKYNISTSSLVKLFGKKWMIWRVWLHKKIKHKIIIKQKTNILNEVNSLNCDFFNKWLYKNNIDPYYSLIFNKKIK